MVCIAGYPHPGWGRVATVPLLTCIPRPLAGAAAICPVGTVLFPPLSRFSVEHGCQSCLGAGGHGGQTLALLFLHPPPKKNLSSGGLLCIPIRPNGYPNLASLYWGGSWHALYMDRLPLSTGIDTEILGSRWSCLPPSFLRTAMLHTDGARISPLSAGAYTQQRGTPKT